MQGNKQQNLLTTIPRLLQHTNLQEQLPHLLVFFTSESEQQQAFEKMQALYKESKSNKLTHHLMRCESFSKLQKQLNSFLATFAQQEKKCHIVVCASIDYSERIRGSLHVTVSRTPGVHVQVFFIFFTTENQDRAKNTVLEFERLVEEGKAERQMIQANLVKYQHNSQRIKAQVYLNWKSSQISILSLLQQIFYRLIREEYSDLSTLQEKVCIFTKNTIANSTYLQRICSFLLEIREQNQQNRGDYKKLVYLLDSLGIMSKEQIEQQGQDQRERIKGILKNEGARQIIKKIMSVSSQMEMLGYLKAVFQFLWAENRSKHMQESGEADVCINIPKEQFNRLQLQEGSQIVSKSLIFATADDKIEKDSMLVCIAVQSNKFCYKIQSQQNVIDTYMIWPLSMFQVEGKQSDLLRLKYIKNILQSPQKLELPEKQPQNNLTNNLRHENWQQLKHYLPLLKEEILSSGLSLFEKNQYSYMRLTKKQKQRCNEILFSLTCFLESQNKNKDALKIGKMHFYLLTQVQIKQYLESTKKKAIKGQPVQFVGQVQLYSQVCIKLAQLYEKEGYLHQSLQVLQDFITNFPIYYHFKDVLQDIKKGLSGQQPGISQLNFISIRLILRICNYFSKLNQQYLSQKFSKIFQLQQTLTQCHPPKQKTQKNRVKQLRLQMQHFKNQLCLLNDTNVLSKELKNKQNVTNQQILYRIKIAEKLYQEKNFQRCLQVYGGLREVFGNFGCWNKMAIDCELGIIKCLEKMGKEEQSILEYQKLIEKICGIVEDCVDGVDTEEAILQDYTTIIKNVHIAYFQLLLRVGRQKQAMQVYQQYVLYYADEEQITDYRQFITIH